MPRRAWRLWTLTLCLGWVAPAAWAQQAGSAASCSAPEQLQVPQYTKFMADNPRYIVTRVFPLGWSKSGLFAWILTQFEDAAGRVTVTFQALNTVNDRVVDEITADYPASETAAQESALSQFWKSKQKRICATLARKGIERQRLALAPFPYGWRDEAIDAYVKPAARTNGPVDLVCRSSKRGEKRIATLQPVQAPDDTRVPFPVGGIPSPSGDRLVVLVAQEVPGSEGPPDTVVFRPFGCDLSTGFLPAAPR